MKIVHKAVGVLVFGLVAPVVILGFTAYISMKDISRKATDESVKSLMNAAHTRIREITLEKAYGIEEFLADFHNDVFLLKQYYEQIDRDFSLYNVEKIPGRSLHAGKNTDGLPAYGYIRPEYGAYADYERLGKGCPWLPKRVVSRLLSDDKYRAEVILTLDKAMMMTPLFETMGKTYGDTMNLVWIVTGLGVDNAFPPYDYPEVIKQNPAIADLDENEENYVRLVNPKNDPERAVRWLDPYFDQFKFLWMTSCAAPLYRGDVFLGSVGIDLLLPTVTKKIVDIRVEKQGYGFLISNAGKLIAIPENGIRDLIWDVTHRKALLETFLPQEKQKWTPETIDALSSMTMDRSPDENIRKVIAAMKLGGTGQKNITLSGEDKIISYAPIKNTGWSIGIVVPVAEVIAPCHVVTKTIDRGTKDIVRQFLSLALIVACISVLISISLHSGIARPLAQLTAKVAGVNWDNLEFNDGIDGRKDEIGRLSEKFAQMVVALRSAKAEVMEKERELEETNERLRDVTERRKMEQAILEAERNYRVLFESSQDAIMLLDGNRWIDCNEAALRIFGLSLKEELINKNPAEMSPPKQPDGRDSLDSVKEHNDNVYAKGGPDLFEWTHVRHDGTLFSAEVLLSRIELKGKVILQATVRDITDRKRMEQAQRLSQIGELAAGVAHEVNNPLMIISGRAQLSLMDELKNKEVEENLNIIMQQCLRAKGIIQRLITFAEPDAEKKEETDINECLDLVLKLVEYKYTNVGVRVIRDFSLSLPKVRINVRQMQDALMNIVKNAAEAMPMGGAITVMTFRKGDKIHIEIKDAGCGMAADTLKKIYDPFFSMKEQRTGLGVPVSYGIIKAHGGAIKFESELGKGTKVVIILPVQESV